MLPYANRLYFYTILQNRKRGSGNRGKVQHSRDKVQRPVKVANQNNSLHSACSVAYFRCCCCTSKLNAMRYYHIKEVATLLL